MSFWDGLMTDENCWIMIIGATNRPNDVDAAILRRMPTRFHIGLPVSGCLFQRFTEFLGLILQREWLVAFFIHSLYMDGFFQLILVDIEGEFQ